MFITFVQNNSGGYFMKDENVDVFVIIECDNLEDILDKANVIFRDYRKYCNCCGERWDDDWKDDNDLDQEPMIYGESVYKLNDSWFKGDKAIIHRKNGVKEVLEL